jgi:hypothetical protein
MEEAERQARFDATNRLLQQHGLQPLNLAAPSPVEQPKPDKEMLLAESLGLDALHWKAISGCEGTILGLGVNKCTFRTLKRQCASKEGLSEEEAKEYLLQRLRAYAKYRLALSKKPLLNRQASQK